ncbi:MAG: MBL fold metallo-hydrolase [Clostridia bacterium]|nr:MBL fold metallo-hydrolase [Clostridia bacterium]
MLKQENITKVRCGAYEENAYLVCPDGRSDAFIVDPGDDLNALLAALEQSGRTLSAILLTHGHFDHMLAAAPLAERTGAEIFLADEDRDMILDRKKCAYHAEFCVLPMPEPFDTLPYGDTLDLCGVKLRIIRTPGHSKGSVCIYDPIGGILFAGDTLFMCGYGRTDLHGGSTNELVRSLRMLFTLPGETKVCCGHGSDTTIGDEMRRYNL